IYHKSIYEYYKNDKDLYNNLEYVIGLIHNITRKNNSPCTQSINFRKPTNLVQLLNEEQARRLAEEQLRSLAENKHRGRLKNKHRGVKEKQPYNTRKKIGFTKQKYLQISKPNQENIR
ncbi:CYIR protein, partial [Plasmodium cynomolgi strain B]